MMSDMLDDTEFVPEKKFTDSHKTITIVVMVK